MASKLLNSLVAGSLILSSSVAAAQAAPEPATEQSLGQNGESALGEGGSVDAVTAIIFGLIVFVIAIWVSRGDEEPESP